MKLKLVTFPNGVQVQMPDVSVEAVAVRMQGRYPRPDPPRQEVDYGGRKGFEFNYANPEYNNVTIPAWESFIEGKAAEGALKKIAKITLTEPQREQIKAWKAENEDEWDNLDLDRDLFFENIVLQTTADFEHLMVTLGLAEKEKGEAEATAEGF